MLIEVLLGTNEDLPNILRWSQVGQGIGDGVVVLEPQQRRELLLIQLFDADPDVVSKYEVQKNLLLAVEVVLMMT
jgi:hypothetical protein